MTVVEELSSLQSVVPVVQGFSAEKIAETLSLLRNAVVERVLRDFFDYSDKWKERRYVVGTIMYLAGLDPRVAAVVRCFVDAKKHRGNRQEAKVDAYRRLVETTRKQLAEGVMEVLRYCSREKVTI